MTKKLSHNAHKIDWHWYSQTIFDEKKLEKNGDSSFFNAD